jgi:desulfoferrodoxin (superoxide reductase-like protein)
MRRDGTPRTVTLSRRSFLALASAAVGSRIAPAWAGAPDAAGAGGAARPADGDHALLLRVPRFTTNGAKVPIVVETGHPMTPGHHVTTVRVRNESDPISSKGTFHFTPANGRVHLSFQARMHEGVSEVTATAECNLHGTFSASSPIEIPAGAGGCLGGGAPKVGRAPGDDVGPPVIRIAELVERGTIRRGELVHVQVKMRHPNRTGLVFREGRLVQESEPIHLDGIEVLYDDEPVSRFAMTSALSDDPFTGFALLARREGTLRVVVTNSRGQRFEATHELHLA